MSSNRTTKHIQAMLSSILASVSLTNPLAVRYWLSAKSATEDKALPNRARAIFQASAFFLGGGFDSINPDRATASLSSGAGRCGNVQVSDSGTVVGP